MTTAEVRISPVSSSYVLEADGRLSPVDRSEDLRRRIRAVLRNQEIVSAVSDRLETNRQGELSLWTVAVDVAEEQEGGTPPI